VTVLECSFAKHSQEILRANWDDVNSFEIFAQKIVQYFKSP
jgi:hypothetical protein